jgi:branched-chain amino acid aminotransferase
MPFSPGPFAPVRLILDSEKRGNLSCYKHKLISYAANARYMRESEQSGTETLFLDYRGFLLETATANLFLIRDNAILTPHHSLPLLDGIIRGELLKTGSFGPFSVKEALISASDFGSFDGAFLTNAGKKVIWASSLGKKDTDPKQFHKLDRMLRDI